MGICSATEHYLREIIKKNGLYLSYRFMNISEYDENKDIVASKQARYQEPEREFEDEFEDEDSV